MNIRRTISSSLFLLLVPSANVSALASEADCDWFAYRMEFNWPNAPENKKSIIWDADRAAINRPCNMTWDQYKALKKKTSVVKRQVPAKPRYHKEVPVNDTPLSPSYSDGSGKTRPNPSGTTSSKGVR